MSFATLLDRRRVPVCLCAVRLPLDRPRLQLEEALREHVGTLIRMSVYPYLLPLAAIPGA